MRTGRPPAWRRRAQQGTRSRLKRPRDSLCRVSRTRSLATALRRPVGRTRERRIDDRQRWGYSLAQSTMPVSGAMRKLARCETWGHQAAVTRSWRIPPATPGSGDVGHGRLMGLEEVPVQPAAVGLELGHGHQVHAHHPGGDTGALGRRPRSRAGGPHAGCASTADGGRSRACRAAPRPGGGSAPCRRRGGWRWPWSSQRWSRRAFFRAWRPLTWRALWPSFVGEVGERLLRRVVPVEGLLGMPPAALHGASCVRVRRVTAVDGLLQVPVLGPWMTSSAVSPRRRGHPGRGRT